MSQPLELAEENFPSPSELNEGRFGDVFSFLMGPGMILLHFLQ